MDGFKYIDIHQNEESPFRALCKVINELNKEHPEIVEGMAELFKSGVLETPEVQAKTREVWQQSWK